MNLYYIFGALIILFNTPISIWTIINIVIYSFLFKLVINAMAYIRARNDYPTGYKDGMYFDLKTNKVIGVRTAVHTDPVTGQQFFGKQKKRVPNADASD